MTPTNVEFPPLPTNTKMMRVCHAGYAGWAYLVDGILVISWDDGDTEWFR